MVTTYKNEGCHKHRNPQSVTCELCLSLYTLVQAALGLSLKQIITINIYSFKTALKYSGQK
jgi:hypothetical protein